MLRPTAPMEMTVFIMLFWLGEGADTTARSEQIIQRSSWRLLSHRGPKMVKAEELER